MQKVNFVQLDLLFLEIAHLEIIVELLCYQLSVDNVKQDITAFLKQLK